jgi:tricorn protease
MRAFAALALLCFVPNLAAQDQVIRLPRQPRVSPDGETIAFAWQQDVWTVPSSGGMATRLTLHPADDSQPWFTPDGAELAFVSDRSGGNQVYIVSVQGGEPRQVTHDSNRKTLLGFADEGRSLVVAQGTDRGWNRGESNRLYLVDVAGERPKQMLFDAGFADAVLSPDEKQVLFTRGSASWTRKGYSGAMALQLWLADLNEYPPKLTRLDRDRPGFQNVSTMDPMWAPDGAGYYYVSDPDGVFDVYFKSLDGSKEQRITQVAAADRSDDGVVYPSLSADGMTLVFRRRFDLCRLDLTTGAIEKLELMASGDAVADALERRTETAAGNVAFTDDGKQMAFVAGEDVFVMDRILREPVRVTDTPHEESSLVFSADGKRLYFVSDAGGEVDIWEATHAQEENIWWLAKSFTLRQVTDDRAVEAGLKLSPGSEHIAYVKDDDLFVMDSDGSDHRRVVRSWSRPDFDWAPDGKWLTYAAQDSDYNSDIWIVSLDGTSEPFNISRHPDNDSDPVWSPDGKRIAFVSQRDGEERDIYYVNLAKEEEERTDRDKKLEEALEAMKKKAGSSGSSRGSAGGARPSRSDEPGAARGPRGGGFRRGGAQAEPAASPQEPEKQDDEKKEGDEDEKKKEKEPVKVTIDFDGILERLHRISIADSSESGLVWSPDGKKLAFSATVEAERGFYTVEFPDVEKPVKLASAGLGNARWLKETNEIVGTSSGGGDSGRGATPATPPATPTPRRGGGGFGGGGGTPAAMSARGQLETFAFSARRERDWHAVRQVSFDQGWRAMRDEFYDESMNNRDWDKIREKYRPVAAQCLGSDEFSELMNMMLGELNASHMGHSGGSDPLPRPTVQSTWTPTTYHLGLRYDQDDEGPGLRVASVIPGSPCHKQRSRVEAGETLLAIDGTPVGPDVDLDRVLTLDEVRDLELTVADREGNERTVTVRPVSSVQGLLYDEWVENNRLAVEQQSEGRLGYLHIQGMNMQSFRQMEEDLYHAGHGKEGLIIDVRFNGGGSTTDHVLTALTQPVHAITRSRDSGEGYPQDRKVYATWTKPIVLMCNEYSFSNAEIFSHAIKQIGRGRLVGMRTAGGVISTGSQRLLDGSSVRMPTRGWYLATTGEDMELNGCLPDIALWNPPGGPDLQLEAAVTALLEDVASEQAQGGVKVVPAAFKRLQENGNGGKR